jgi:hypothetical protein
MAVVFDEIENVFVVIGRHADKIFALWVAKKKRFLGTLIEALKPLSGRI